MRRFNPVLLLLSVCLIVPAGLGGCQSPRQHAEDALARELAQRREARAAALELYQRGMDAYEAGELTEAGQRLNRAVIVDPRLDQAWLALGVVEFDGQRFFEAARAFDRAAKLRPLRYEPQFNLARVFEDAGLYDKAIDAYERARKLAPDQLEVIENLARCYLHVGEDEPARPLLEQALLREQRSQWRQWLQRQALRLRNPKDPVKTNEEAS